MEGLSALVQEALKIDPFCGHLLSFRGREANVIKILFWDLESAETLAPETTLLRADIPAR
jgi:transposase